MKKFISIAILSAMIMGSVLSANAMENQATASAPVPAPGYLAISVVTPKRMSIRLRDGNILKTGDEFIIKEDQEIIFQMCSDNWTTGKFDDAGNGISGTVVYKMRVSERNDERSYDAATHSFVIPRGDLVLRTDVNRCFMAYKFHFKQDYNKQTGIQNVVNPPLESLSVNLPLGSTVKTDAFVDFKQVGSEYIFIQTAGDETLSYADYTWNY